MAQYEIKDNPYYTPFHGRNFIIDRLAAAMDAPTAPEHGAYGDKVGFLGTLFGSDRNRRNEAAQQRQVDIDQGKKPFEAEAGSEIANIDETGNQAVRRDAANVPNLLKVHEAEAASRMQQEQEQQRGFNARQAEELNAQTQNEAMHRATQIAENSANRRANMELHTTPTVADTIRMTKPTPLGQGNVMLPGGGVVGFPSMQFNDNGGKPVHYPSEDDLNFLQNPNATIPTGQRQSGDLDYLKKMQDQVERAQGLIAPPRNPTGISY